MNKEIEIKVFDSLGNLPDCRWTDMIEDFEKEFAVKWYAIFAYKQDDIIGFMRVSRNPDDICEWYISDVHVNNEHQRRGIATCMYKKAIQIVNKFECATNIIVSVSASNEPSVALHKKIGFIDQETKPKFANYIFEEDETKYCYWLSNCYPAKNVPAHIDILFPMWKKYMSEIGENDSESDMLDGLCSRINIANTHDNIFFEMIWSGNNAIGFAFYSIDGGIKNLIPSGYGYIMEFYVLPEWRKKRIGSYCSNYICNKLYEAGCPQVYLTSVPNSDNFWNNNVFVKSNLFDPYNKLNIWFRQL